MHRVFVHHAVTRYVDEIPQALVACLCRCLALFVFSGRSLPRTPTMTRALLQTLYRTSTSTTSSLAPSWCVEFACFWFPFPIVLLSSLQIHIVLLTCLLLPSLLRSKQTPVQKKIEISSLFLVLFLPLALSRGRSLTRAWICRLQTCCGR